MYLSKQSQSHPAVTYKTPAIYLHMEKPYLNVPVLQTHAPAFKLNTLLADTVDFSFF